MCKVKVSRECQKVVSAQSTMFLISLARKVRKVASRRGGGPGGPRSKDASDSEILRSRSSTLAPGVPIVPSGFASWEAAQPGLEGCRGSTAAAPISGLCTERGHERCPLRLLAHTGGVTLIRPSEEAVKVTRVLDWDCGTCDSSLIPMHGSIYGWLRLFLTG